MGDDERLAVEGGAKAVPEFDAQGPDYGAKVGGDEFMALAEAWGYSEESRTAIKRIVEQEEDRIDPMLLRYYADPSQVARFEDVARSLFGVRYALGLNSCTSALIAACVACGVGPGTEVIVPGYTFLATAAAVVVARGIPVIAEIDETLTLDPDDVEKKITPRTKAIIPVHMQGNCANLDRIMALAERHGLAVIEDVAQACGGRYHGQPLGTIRTVGCFSLSSVKIIGCGEGGLLITDDEWLYTRARNQHDTAGCWREDRYAPETRPGELFCGENYRMSELAGAVNRVQLEKAEAQSARYRKNHRLIVESLESFSRTRPRPSNDPDGDIGNLLLFLAESGEKASILCEALLAEGVPARARGGSTTRDWHIYKYWDHILERKTAAPGDDLYARHPGPLPEYGPDMCPVTLDLTTRTLGVPVNQWWTETDCRSVARAINKVCGKWG